MPFSDAEREAVASAIAAAEKRTSGEIVCIVDEKPHRYVGTTLTVAALLAFVLPLAAVLLGAEPARLVPVDAWSTGDPQLDMVRGFEAYALVQLIIFLALAALLWWTRLGAWLTPMPIKRDRVHAQALAQFRARGLERTRDRTGVLIFACMTDHVAEVVADAAIYERVEPEFWGSTIVALLGGIKAGRTADGLVAAVAHAGGALAEHFPPRADDSDELPNHLIEL